MARLPIGYRERKDGSIECRFTIDGKRYSCYADTIKECREKERKLRDEIADGLYTKNKNLTLDKYYEEWKNARKGTIKGNTALGNNSRYKNHIKPALGHRKLVVFNASVNKAITETLKRINKKKVVIEHFSAHVLRDTFATRYIEQGGSPQVLKTILGHSSLAMTMDLYSHVMPNTKQKEMDSIKIVL